MAEESSTTRNWLLVTLALGLLALAVYFVWFGDPSSGPREIYPPTGAAPVVGLESPSAQPLRGAEDTGQEVFVELEVLARALPPRPERPQCFLVARSGDPGIAGTFVAGVAALPLARKLRGPQLVRFDLGTSGVHYRMTRLVPTDRGRIELLRGQAFGLRGKVVDQGGKPVREATVWLAGEEVLTDGKGLFDLPAVPADAGLPLVIRKAGYTTHFEILAGAQFPRREETPFVLRPGVSLHVRGDGPLAADADCVLLPIGGRDTRLLRTPFFWSAVRRPARIEDGMLVFDGLPQGARFQVRLRQPGRAAAWSPVARLTRPQQVVVAAGARAPQIEGVVVDGEQGTPLPDAWITARPADRGLSLRDTDWLLPPQGYLANGDLSRTGADGAFAVASLRGDAQRVAVTVEAEGYCGLEYLVAAKAGQALPVRLFRETARGTPSLRLEATGLPPRVRLRVKDERRTLGPYGWDTTEPFPLAVSRRSLIRVTTRIGEGAPRSRVVLVLGETPVAVLAR